MSKEFKPQVVLPTFYRAANDCLYYLTICGISLIDDSHRESLAKLAADLHLELQSITDLAKDGKDSKD